MSYSTIGDAKLEQQVQELREGLDHPVDPALLFEIVKIRKAIEEIRTVLQGNAETVAKQKETIEDVGRLYGEVFRLLQLLGELNESLVGKLAGEKIQKMMADTFQAVAVGQMVAEPRV